MTPPVRQSYENVKQIQQASVEATILNQWNMLRKDAVVDVASLPSTGNTVDDCRVVEEDGFVYKWNGASRAKLSPYVNLSYNASTGALTTINGNSVSTLLTIQSGSWSPVWTNVPRFIWDRYLDTAWPTIYTATGATNNDWIA